MNCSISSINVKSMKFNPKCFITVNFENSKKELRKTIVTKCSGDAQYTILIKLLVRHILAALTWYETSARRLSLLLPTSPIKI